MIVRTVIVLAALALATPAVAGGHPNGKQKEFYAISRNVKQPAPPVRPSCQPGKVCAAH